jgi:hypothetical protein
METAWSAAEIDLGSNFSSVMGCCWLTFCVQFMMFLTFRTFIDAAYSRNSLVSPGDRLSAGLLPTGGAVIMCFTLLLRGMVLLLLAMLNGPLQAQDLEPRRWSHLPSGLNVLGLGVGYTNGDILFDPALNIEDATYDLYLGAVVYVRSFELFGKSARVDTTVPYAAGRWEGLLNGEQTSVRRRGFADPRIRFSINLYGAPALSGKEYVQYRRAHPVTTTVGAGLAVRLPLGDYNDQYLINLGRNRFVVRPQLGVLHQRYKWQFEVTGSVFLHQSNDEFWDGNTLKQGSLWFLQGHVIYTFKPGWWASFSGGFAHGGRSSVNGVDKTDDRRQRYIALSLGVPINKRQGLKFTYLTSDTNITVGTNVDALLAAWSINWGGQ